MYISQITPSCIYQSLFRWYGWYSHCINYKLCCEDFWGILGHLQQCPDSTPSFPTTTIINNGNDQWPKQTLCPAGASALSVVNQDHRAFYKASEPLESTARMTIMMLAYLVEWCGTKEGSGTPWPVTTYSTDNTDDDIGQLHGSGELFAEVGLDSSNK